MVRPKDVANVPTSEAVRSMLKNSINPMEAKIAFRSVRPISVSGLLLSLESAEDEAKLLAEIGEKGLEKDLIFSKPKERDPEIVVFGVDPDLEDSEIIPPLKGQNTALEGADIKVFQGKTGTWRYDPESMTRLRGVKRIKVGWKTSEWKPSTRPLQCYRYFRLGHTQKICESAALCKRCGGSNHKRKEWRAHRRALLLQLFTVEPETS